MKVSVVIPAFNAEKYLAAAIDSVLAQTTLPLEIVVVDDGSTDGTAAIARSYGGIVRCISQENRGLSEARNRGMREAAGDVIALLDADDLWLPEKLQAQIEQMSEGVVACFTECEHFTDRGPIATRQPAPRLDNLVEHLLLASCVVGPPSAALIRSAALGRAGLFDPQFSQCADWDMWIRLARVGEVRVVPRRLVRYRIHEANMSRDVALLEKDTFAVLEKFFRTSDDPRLHTMRRHIESNHWMILSGSYLHAGSVRQSLRCLVRALIFYPPNAARALGAPLRWLGRRAAGRAQ